MILNDDYLFGCFFSINSEQIFLIINQFNANYFSKMFRKNCVSFAFQIHTTQTQCSPITENFDKKFNKRWHISTTHHKLPKTYTVQTNTAVYMVTLSCLVTKNRNLTWRIIESWVFKPQISSVSIKLNLFLSSFNFDFSSGGYSRRSY